jgi:phage shock protein C
MENNIQNKDEENSGSKIEAERKEDLKQKKLRRSRIDRIFFGVCGGLGEFFGVNPIIFRLFFIISLLIGAWGIVIYLILSLVIPNTPLLAAHNYSDFPNVETRPVIGIFLIFLGIYLLVKDIGVLEQFSFFGFTHQIIIPAILIVVFIMFFVQYDVSFADIDENKSIFRTNKNKIFSGVCSSLSEYFNIDVNFMRIIFILFTILTLGIGLLIYLIYSIMIPLEKESDIAG